MNSANVVMGASNRTLNKANAGFTLIELMISIVLGLLVVAAASQLMLGGLVSSRLQQGAADAQDSGLFGLDYLAKDIRLANYGNIQNLIMNELTPWGGVVLTADTATPNATVTNLATVRTGVSSSNYVPNGLLSHGAGDTASTTVNQWQGLTKVNVSAAATTTATASQSDQLTIQFIAPTAMTNCKGESVGAGDRVIQRYFLRADTTDSSALVLACDAALIPAAVPVQNAPTTVGTGGALAAGTYYYVVTAIKSTGGDTDKSAEQSISTIGATSSVTVSWAPYSGATGYKIYRGTTSGDENTMYQVGAVTAFTDVGGLGVALSPPAVAPIVGSFDGLGQVMMPRVEHMHILLGTQTAAGLWQYYSIHDYMYSTITPSPKPQIKSIQVSVLVRSLDNTNSAAINSNPTFTMLDQTVTPTATGSANRYVRRVYTTTIALRNGFGSP